MRFIIDSNVCIVANGQNTDASISCRLASIDFLEAMINKGILVIDADGDIEIEYRRHLNAKSPGVGNRFLQAFLNAASRRIERVKFVKAKSGEYADFPTASSLRKFDKSDRKFAALSIKSKAAVANATDTDWLDHKEELEKFGVRIEFLCGVKRASWFARA